MYGKYFMMCNVSLMCDFVDPKKHELINGKCIYDEAKDGKKCLLHWNHIKQGN